MDNSQYDPNKLVAAIRSGDEAAFEAFYRGYVDSLVAFLTKILRNEEDAKEITQDTFATLWENRATLDPHTSLKGFVAGTARHLAFRMLRSKSRGVAGEELYPAQPGAAEMTDDGIISDETEMILRSVLCNMPAQRRKVFEMSRDENMTYNEIAQALNISYNTVVKHISLAKEEIRSTLTLIILIVLSRL